MRSGLAFTLALLASGCFSLSIKDNTVRCHTTAPECPNGYQCAPDGYCYADGDNWPMADMMGQSRDMSGASSGNGHQDLGASSSDMSMKPSPDMAMSSSDMATPHDMSASPPSPHIHLSLSTQALDLIALGTPLQTATITATLTNLEPGDLDTVTFAVASNSSAQITAGAMGGLKATVAPAASLNGIQSSPPPQATITVTADSDPSATATVVVTIHAWVDESAGVAQVMGLSYPSRLWAVDIAPTGGVFVGGWTSNPALSSSQSPYIAGALLTGSTWVPAFTDQNAGMISSISAAADGSFLAAGVASNQSLDAQQTKPIFAYHCSTASCNDSVNLVPTTTGNCGANETSDAFPSSVCPHIATLGTSKFLAYTRDYDVSVQGACADLRYPESKVVYDTSGDITASFVMTNVLKFGNDQGTAAGNSCPFAGYATTGATASNAVTGLVTNSDQIWISGYASCTDEYNDNDGCTSATDFANIADGLAAITVGAQSWRSYHSAAVDGDLDEGVIKRGYDGSVLGIRAAASSGGPSSLMWYTAGDPPVTPQYVRPLIPSGASDTGVVIGGSAAGGSPWSPTTTDVFYVFSRSQSGTTTYNLGWQPSLDPSQGQVATVGTGQTGIQLLDMSFVKTSAGVVEGYAVGQRLDTGAPVVAHLK